MIEEKLIEDQNKEAYNANNIVKKDKKQNHYEESINALINYMENTEKNPSEKRWDCYAIFKKHLSSKTLGYLYGKGFNTLCKDIRKQINKKKRQMKK